MKQQEINSQDKSLDREEEKHGFSEFVKHNFWGLLTVLAISVACFVIVQVFKRPGQMSVLESQAMDMTVMVPPRGAVPVGIATVTEESIEGSLIYTGTVQAFNDEDIYPRVTGLVTSIPVYAGDRVRKGQLLVQLDRSGSSEYDAKKQEAAGAEDASVHAAAIAKNEFMQKKFQFEAADDAVLAAEKAVEENNATLAYWKPELARQTALLKSEVISLDEFQKAESEMKAAQARVEQAQAKLREAKKNKLASQAEYEAMMHHISHQFSGTKEAKAALKNAEIYERYTRILAQDDAVVTKRVVSPGVLASPGMLLLKVANIKKVRVQAEISSSDAEKVHLGDKVFVSGTQDSSKSISATISSIFPAADPTSRTFTVEALIDNIVSLPEKKNAAVTSITQYRYLPGQYVIMRIISGQKDGLAIPTSAVVWREGRAHVWKAIGGGTVHKTKKFQCPMHPEVLKKAAGECPKCGMTLEEVSRGASGSGKTVYSCPMHSSETSDKAGKCPKCGMELEAKEEPAGTQKKKIEYTCTMHPEINSEQPGKCPKCSMDLTPKELSGKKSAELVEIKVGLSNPDKTEVVEGLEEGDEVIYAGYANLQPGVAVVGTDWGKSGPEKLPTAAEMSGNRLDGSNGFTAKQSSGELSIALSMPEARGSNNKLKLKIEKKGEALSSAQIKIKTSMPGMNMPGPELSGSTDKNGEAEIQSNIMSGLWQLDLSVSAANTETANSSFEVEVP